MRTIFTALLLWIRTTYGFHTFAAQSLASDLTAAYFSSMCVIAGASEYLKCVCVGGKEGEVKIVKIILYTEINLFLQKMDVSTYTAKFSCQLCSKNNSIMKQIICLKNQYF